MVICLHISINPHHQENTQVVVHQQGANEEYMVKAI